MPYEAGRTATTQSLAADIVPLVIRDRLLEIGERQHVLPQLADPIELPTGNGKVIQMTRYERMALPNSPLAEGQTPNATAITTSVVQAIVDQWGAFSSMTDVAQLTVKHPILRIHQERLGDQRAELIDREIQRVLLGGTNVTFAGGAASRAAVGAGDVVNSALVRQVLGQLRSDGARPWPDGFFRGVFDPFVEQDLNNDTTFVTAASNNAGARLAAGSSLLTGEVGPWLGVRWMRCNFLPRITQLTGITVADQTTIPGWATGFTAGSTVRAKVTRLDPQTGFETVISDEASATDVAAFVVEVTIATATAGTGTFNIYVSLEGGAAGTATFQRRVVATSGSPVYTFAAAGTPATPATDAVVTATGAVAPPDTSATATIHTSYIFGRGSFGLTRLGGLTTTLTPATASDSDPLVQRRMVGWKQLLKAIITNPTFFARIESDAT